MVRPNKGLDHVDGLEGDRQSKRRLRGILSTNSGLQPVDDVCGELGICPTYFADLRTRVLRASLDELAPRPVGRPPRRTTLSVQEVEAMRQRIADLEHEVALLHTRLELAAVAAMRETRQSKSPGRTMASAHAHRSAAAARRAVP
jgi:hypothetical protein